MPTLVQAQWISASSQTKAARLEVAVPASAQPGHLLLVRLPPTTIWENPTQAEKALYATYSRKLAVLLLPRIQTAENRTQRAATETRRMTFSVVRQAHPPRDNDYGNMHVAHEVANVAPLVASRKGYDMQLRFALTIPEGAEPGVLFPVDCDGRLCHLRVPRHARPGDTLHCAPTWGTPPEPRRAQEPAQATRRVVIELPPDAQPGQRVTANLEDGTPISFMVPENVSRSRRICLKLPAEDTPLWAHPTGSLVASALQLV